VKEGEEVGAPEFLAFGEPKAKGVAAAAAAVLLEEALIDGALEPAVEGGFLRRIRGGPVAADLGPVPLVGRISQDGTEHLPVAREVFFEDGAAGEIVGAISGPFDDKLARGLGEAGEGVEPAAAVIIAGIGVGPHFHEDVNAAGKGAAATSGPTDGRVVLAGMVEDPDGKAASGEAL